ncbi:MAG TPA: hypothetical protein VN026_11715, partial [Bacteroidia bacterium]|nr:hypothetical protein [Bacteroidia bacterium]
MKTIKMLKQLLTAIIVIAFVSSPAREKQGNEAKVDAKKIGDAAAAKVMSACKGAKESKEMWINNVRTVIFTAGDMWWDLFGNGNPIYGLPGIQDRSIMLNSNFAGSLWIGGLDAGGQLKVAAMTYRQNGYDFWPGPLDTTNASTDESVCNLYDKIFYMTRPEVDNFIANAVISDNIKNWPGNPLDPSKPHGTLLAPFFDQNGDNFYDPTVGDYPYYDVYNKATKSGVLDEGVCAAKLFGDATFWWVFNDKGDIHTETNGQSIGLEVRAQCFAFKTSDEINNMTFYDYQVINRSSFTLNKTFFSVWDDCDLGCYNNDYTGCDIQKGLGFQYESTGYDASCAGEPGYLDFPAAYGCDFFRGPLADANDGIDNDMDGVIDEPGECWGMSKFLYYNNNIGAFPVQTTNPSLASHYYGYMTGFWKDGSAFTEGGNAYGGTTPTNYCYPGELYPTRTGWNEYDAGNLAGDRRFIESAGPFTLKPGAVNNVIFGLPWARSPVKNGNLFAVSLMKVGDLKAQALFDNCFKILDGPEAPDLTIQEESNELLLYLSNKPISNNYLNQYQEKDVTILGVPGQTASCLANPDPNYYFEGYKVYQLKDPTVSQTDLDDETKAKLIFQCDIKNGVTRLINYNFDGSIGADVPKVKVEGSDGGILTTFKVTDDVFATLSNKKLINNKTYYFMSVAYAYNNYATYKPDTDPTNSPCINFYGQKRPYLEGRKIKKAAGIPHMFDPQKDGTVTQSTYGYGPKITRIEGQGNGGNSMDLTDESVSYILGNNFMKNPIYQNGRGPIGIKVIDPLNVPNSVFSVKFLKLPTSVYNSTNTPIPANWSIAPSGTVMANSDYLYGFKYVATGSVLRNDSITWILTNKSNGQIYQPKKSIKVGEEYYFSDLGLSVNIQQVPDPSASLTTTIVGVANYGDLIEASMTFADPLNQWLTGLPDTDDPTPSNWIRSGNITSLNGTYSDYGTDPNKVFAKILGGTWAPYCLTGGTTKTSSSPPAIDAMAGPGYNGNFFANPDQNKPSIVDYRFLASVDVVLTPDK